MKNNILDIIKNDTIIKEITGYFEEQFLKGYNSIKDKNEILNIRDTLFKRWYYSAMVQLTYLNPSYLINEIAQQKIQGNYVIMPHIEPEFSKKNKVKFTYSYKYFSIEEHPVVKDLISLVEFSTPSVHIDPKSDFILQNGEKFIDQINYRNTDYLIYLLELAKEMKLLEEMPSIGTTCLKPSKGYDEFLKLSKGDQLYKVIDNSINVSVQKFNEQPFFSSKLTRQKILDMIDNGVTYDKYLNETVKNTGLMEQFLEHAKNLGNDEIVETILNNSPEDLTAMLSQTYFGIYIDMWFVSVFGYYLGIITPNYIDVYDVSANMNELILCEDTPEKLHCMYAMNQAHDLTPLGTKIMSLFKNIESQKNFNKIKEDALDEMLLYIREQMNIVLIGKLEESMEAMMEMFNCFTEEDYGEDYEDYYGFDEYFEAKNKEVDEHISKFFNYLTDSKNLKESTAQKHAQNMKFFCKVYLDENLKLDTRVIKADVTDAYMNFYINHGATSKTNVKDQLVSFKHYATYMESMGLIDTLELDKIKEVCKKKEYYGDKYEEYWFGDRFVTKI